MMKGKLDIFPPTDWFLYVLQHWPWQQGPPEFRNKPKNQWSGCGGSPSGRADGSAVSSWPPAETGHQSVWLSYRQSCGPGHNTPHATFQGVYVSVSQQVLADMYMSFVFRVLQSGQLKGVNPVWLARARGSFQRAVTGIKSEIYNTDLTDPEACRILNDRIMRVRETLQLLALFSVLQQRQSVEWFILFNDPKPSVSDTTWWLRIHQSNVMFNVSSSFWLELSDTFLPS